MSEDALIGKVNIEKSTYKWEIDNISDIFNASENSKPKLSPKFEVMIGTHSTEWQISLYAKGNKPRNKEYLSLFIRYFSDVNIYVKSYIAIIDLNKIVHGENLNYRLFHKGSSVGFSRFVKQDLLFGGMQLSKDKLIILYEIVFDKAIIYLKKIEHLNDG